MVDRACCGNLEGVGSGLVEVDNRLAGRLSHQQITVLLAPSGSGKTRMLIEAASTRFTLFFTGGRPMVGFGGGSNDVWVVAQWIETRFRGEERDIPPQHPVVEFGVGALILARLTYLKLLKDCKPGLVPRDWAFFQVEYPAVDDVFKHLVIELLGLVHDVNQLPSLVFQIGNAIGKLVEEVCWRDGIVALDEAQALLQCMKGRFKSGRTPQEGQSLLNPVVLALKSYGWLRSPLFVSGTGKSMLTVRENLLSGFTMKTFDVGEIYSLPGFDHNNIGPFMQRFIDVNRLDMPAIISTYVGRRRLLTTAIEQYILETAPSADWFMEFARRMITETGQELGVHRSLTDELDALWNDREMASLIEDLIFTYYFSGAGYVIVPGQSRAMTLVDCGFATLLESNSDAVEAFAPIVPYIRGVTDNNEADTAVTTRYIILGEPLVVNALWHNMPKGTLMERFVNTFRDPAVVGLKFETYACETLGSVFEKKVPAKVLGITKTQVYQQTYKLLEPRGMSGVLVQEVHNVEELDKWIMSVEVGVSFATYARTGPFFEAGPDAMFFLWNDELHKKMPVFVQFKTGRNLGATQAFATLDIMKLDKTVNSQGSHKLKEWCSTGYIRLVVSTHPHPQAGKLAFEEVRQSKRLKENDEAVVPPLSAVWAGERLVGVVNMELLEAVEEVKTNLKKQKSRQ